MEMLAEMGDGRVIGEALAIAASRPICDNRVYGYILHPSYRYYSVLVHPSGD